MRNIAILGSTGSIGTQTVDVVRTQRDSLRIRAIAAYCNDVLIEEQIREFQPDIAVLVDKNAAYRLSKRYNGKTKILAGEDGLMEAATYQAVDTVVTAMVGFAGLKPTLAAIKSNKNIALANKETLVAAGEIVVPLAKEHQVKLLPVDSEHSAIFQCLVGEDHKSIHKIIVTASGGPFRGRTTSELKNVTLEQCLNHPNWSMGRKITVDSSTLANKGLEVIEAHWLFHTDYKDIEVVVHPESIIHSMVMFTDGSVKAQLGMPDMRLPIQYALSYPERSEYIFSKIDFMKLKALTFESPDLETFKPLKMAYEAGQTGGTLPCVFNAANEVAVNAFMQGEIEFLRIFETIDEVMNQHTVIFSPDIENIFAADMWARDRAYRIIKGR